MKIIRTGQNRDNTTHRATCNNCDTEVEFMQKEGHVDKDRDGLHVIVKCPICGRDIYKAL